MLIFYNEESGFLVWIEGVSASKEENMSLAKDNTMVSVGKVGAAVGLKGETKVRLYAEESENLYEGAVLLVDGKKYRELGGDNAVYGVDGSIELEVKSIRYQKGRPVVKFYNVVDRTAAEKLTGAELYIPESELAELEPGHYYYRDLIGLRARDSESGEIIGDVNDMIDNPSQTLLEVVLAEDSRKVLIPYVDAFIKEVSLEDGTIDITLMPGLI